MTTEEDRAKTLLLKADIDAHLKENYVVFTKAEWAAYKLSAAIIFLLLGIGSISGAIVAAKAVVAGTAAAEATHKIDFYKVQAAADAATIHSMLTSEFGKALACTAGAVDDLCENLVTNRVRQKLIAQRQQVHTSAQYLQQFNAPAAASAAK